MRIDGRAFNSLRNVSIVPDVNKYAEGSALVEFGNTKVICTASVEERVPHFLRGKGTGWITAEYSMLPRATESRTPREVGRGGPSGRTHEIQRLIGRSLRAVVNIEKMGERTIHLDCDVIQADGGTRTASITGAYVALVLALRFLAKEKKITSLPVSDYVAAISVGIIKNVPMLDLDYSEDSQAEVDMNIVCTGDGRFIEIQGTAEHKPFSHDQMNNMLGLAKQGIDTLLSHQRKILGILE